MIFSRHSGESRNLDDAFGCDVETPAFAGVTWAFAAS